MTGQVQSKSSWQPHYLNDLRWAPSFSHRHFSHKKPFFTIVNSAVEIWQCFIWSVLTPCKFWTAGNFNAPSMQAMSKTFDVNMHIFNQRLKKKKHMEKLNKRLLDVFEKMLIHCQERKKERKTKRKKVHSLRIFIHPNPQSVTSPSSIDKDIDDTISCKEKLHVDTRQPQRCLFFTHNPVTSCHFLQSNHIVCQQIQCRVISFFFIACILYT